MLRIAVGMLVLHGGEYYTRGYHARENEAFVGLLPHRGYRWLSHYTTIWVTDFVLAP